MHEMNLAGVAQGLSAAESQKALGNQTVARKDRAGAVAHYTEAIESLHDAWGQKPTDEEDKKIRTLLCVCLANRAAAWLLPGTGQDARKALKDAEEAIARDAEYGKAYEFVMSGVVRALMVARCMQVLPQGEGATTAPGALEGDRHAL